jgi:hypothetical protein
MFAEPVEGTCDVHCLVPLRSIALGYDRPLVILRKGKGQLWRLSIRDSVFSWLERHCVMRIIGGKCLILYTFLRVGGIWQLRL